MDWRDVKNYILEDFETAKILFNLDECYIDESFMIDQLDELNASERQEAIESYTRLGFNIKGDDVYYPAKLPFRLEPSNSSSDPNSYYIARNGEEAGVYYADELTLCIELSDIGKKCYKIARDIAPDETGYDAVFSAYSNILSIEHVFGVKIIS